MQDRKVKQTAVKTLFPSALKARLVLSVSKYSLGKWSPLFLITLLGLGFLKPTHTHRKPSSPVYHLNCLKPQIGFTPQASFFNAFVSAFGGGSKFSDGSSLRDVVWLDSPLGSWCNVGASADNGVQIIECCRGDSRSSICYCGYQIPAARGCI